jgi:hypothetical protein
VTGWQRVGDQAGQAMLESRRGQAPDNNDNELSTRAAALEAAYEGYGRPTGERTFITGRDVNNVSEAFYKTHRRAPTPAEAVALGNYNRLSNAHSVGRNRVLAIPNDLSVLDAEKEQRQSLSRSSGSGYISSADAPSYSADMRNIWSNPYSPLGKQIGQTALRTFIPSQ